MADACGQARTLAVLTPIARGREQALREVLERLPVGEQSPLARLPATHFARFVIVPDLGSARLLFSSTFDAGGRDYLEEICTRIPAEADAIWAHCADYPGADDRKAFVGYMEQHRMKANLFVAAYPDATLDEVREALAARRRLSAFVPRAQSMAPEELQATFQEERIAGFP